jgi:hypothetical protein
MLKFRCRRRETLYLLLQSEAATDFEPKDQCGDCGSETNTPTAAGHALHPAFWRPPQPFSSSEAL